MLFHTPEEDIVYTLQYINDFTKKIGALDQVVDDQKIVALIRAAESDGLYPNGGTAAASVFRKMGSFVVFFVSERPLVEPFPKGVMIEDLRKIPNHQNAILAFEIAKDSLHKAKINRKDGVFVLENRIETSRHSYIDIVDALSHGSPATSMKMVAVLLEQLAYRRNPDCQYKDF